MVMYNVGKERNLSVIMSTIGLVFCIIGFACSATSSYITYTTFPLPLLLTGLTTGLIGLYLGAAIASKRRWSLGSGVGFFMGLAAAVGNLYLIFTVVRVYMIMAVG